MLVRLELKKYGHLWQQKGSESNLNFPILPQLQNKFLKPDGFRPGFFCFFFHLVCSFF